MNGSGKRKCLCCGDFFVSDHRNVRHQRYCSKAGCRKESKAQSQRRWQQSRENQNYFRGPENCRRVKDWRKANPGYWRKKKSSTQVPLQDLFQAQVLTMRRLSLGWLRCVTRSLLNATAVLVGLISMMTGSALQEDIASTVQVLVRKGRDRHKPESLPLSNTRWLYSIGWLCSVTGQDVLPQKDGTKTEHCPLMNPLMTELDKDEQFYRDTESIAFPKLDDRQLAMLEPLGARRIVRRGELVYKAGQRNLGLTAVLRGELEVFESRDGQEQILATAGPRRWPMREAKRMRAKFWKCPQIGFARRSRNCPASASRSCARSSCVGNG
jgi:hypothetical protein